MSHYRSNLRDLEFTLFEVFGRGDVLGPGPVRGHRRRHRARDAARGGPAGRARARRQLRRRRPQPAGLRPGDAHRDAARVVQEELRGLHRTASAGPCDLPAELGGTVAPPSLRWAVNEMILGANPAIYMYACGSAFAQHPAQPRHRRAEAARPARWSTSSGARRWSSPSPTPAPTSAPAAPRPSSSADGTWHIEGVKRFITSAEHGPVRQHRPLRARPPRGRRGPGTKGLSLFVVPKFHVVDLEPASSASATASRHQRRAQDGPQGLDHLRGDLRRRRPRRSAPCSATSTTASRRCSRSSSTPG